MALEPVRWVAFQRRRLLEQALDTPPRDRAAIPPPRKRQVRLFTRDAAREPTIVALRRPHWADAKRVVRA
eukprot:1234641-Pyramimonas_sp.AAC.1